MFREKSESEDVPKKLIKVVEEAPGKLNLSKLERKVRIEKIKKSGATLLSEYKKLLKQKKPTLEELDRMSFIEKQARAMDAECKALGDSRILDFFWSCREKFRCSDVVAKSRIIPLVIVTIIVAFLLGGLGVIDHYESQLVGLGAKLAETQVELKQTKTKLAQAEAALAQKQVAIESAKEAKTASGILMERGVVGNKEGYETSFIGQLEANLTLVAGDKRFESYDGKLEDAKALRKWAGKIAHQIAILAGQYKIKTGKELWVKRPGVVVPLLSAGDDGKIVINIHLKTAEGFSKDPDVVLKLADNFKTAKFLGDQKGGVRAYERVHSPT
ncbi:MAG: hypothetical protein A2174_01180 [Candidatus Portnoybacteria bacterium RBG_13_41_18]|uniref:Uncharacterized protein n=1 Tax=Candidatus Portnoybacteria bacterium RBG_13_41_18 TaxID=1801991 RepID=A0A1G2F728_9BACT|nr:MAG: hypothetical protein A2174_01180 [Candidatus Portnoybacteria bacterium RBG_13_41_18]